MALTKWHDGMVTFPAKVNQIPQSLLLVKGVGTTDFYFLEVDPATGQLPVTTTGIGLYDFGATTTAPRQAAVIGNTTGVLDCGTGTTTAQTLRNTPATDAQHLLNTRHEAAVTPLAVRLTNGTGFYSFPGTIIDFGATTNAARVAAVLGNASGAADWGAGAVSAQTLRNTPASDSPHLLATRHEALATPLSVRLGDTSAFVGTSFGVGANSLRVAALLGNNNGIADFGSGANSAQTVRNSPATDAQHLLNTRHEAAGTPLAVRIGNGTSFNPADFGASTLSMRVAAIIGNASAAADFGAGAAGAQTIRVVQATGSVPATSGRTVAGIVRNDYVGSPVTTAAYVQLIASTAAIINRFQIFDSSGQTLVIATGGAGAEVNLFYLTPGGCEIDVFVAAGTRISIKAVSGNASVGELTLNALT